MGGGRAIFLQKHAFLFALIEQRHNWTVLAPQIQGVNSRNIPSVLGLTSL